jgi:hypothetical protein
MPTWKGCIYDERPSHGYPDVIRGQKSAYGNSAAAQLTGHLNGGPPLGLIREELATTGHMALPLKTTRSFSMIIVCFDVFL